MSPDAAAQLRDRLLALRDDVIEQLAEGEALDGGLVARAADIAGALTLLDIESEPPRCRSRGRRTSTTIDGLENGNRALARLRNEYFADLGITRAADEIAALGRRYEVSGWRFDRQKPATEIAGERRRLLAEVLRGRPHFPGSRRVRDVLRETWETNSSAIHFPKSEASTEHDDLDQ